MGLAEDVPDDDTTDDILEADEVGTREREALAAEEKVDIECLLAGIGRLPPDSKLDSLKRVLHELRGTGYGQVMVFTQYTDTMDFLRDALLQDAEARLMCFSGRGGEIPSTDGFWRRISRDDAKRRFRDREADVLLCTDAAAEGLNFQFCGALVNYDMPWNPMRVEQRIGRIDRLGQQHLTIRIVNLHYQDTVETDVYQALRSRIGLFESVVGRLQPILAHMPQMISQTVLSGHHRDARERANAVDAIRTRGAGTRRARVRYRYDDRERHRRAGARAVVCHHGGSRQNHRETGRDAGRDRCPAHGTSGIRFIGSWHDRALAGHHRSGILRRACRKHGTVVAGQCAV